MLDRLRHEDDGFTLVETLAAMIVFAILAVSLAGVILHTFDLSRSNTARVTAANLATKQIEAARAKRGLDVPDGASVLTPKPFVNGVEYTVTQTANYVASNSGTSLCSGTSSTVTSSTTKLAYKLITVLVTWPDMGRVQPVRQDTLLSLGIGFNGVPADKGTAAVAVLGRDGQPVAGVTVTTSPATVSRLTGSDGCAVFTGLVPGTSYRAVAGQSGHVTPAGDPTVSSATFTVTASGVTRVPMSYAPRGAVAAALLAPGGLTPPATLPMTFSSTGFPTPERVFPDCVSVSTSPKGCVSGAPRTAVALFPGLYGVWPGDCADAKPVSPPIADVVSGATTAVQAPLGGVVAHLQNSAGQPAPGTQLYAVHPADTSCLTGAVWPLTPAGGSTQSLALPPGAWKLATTPDPNAAGTAVTIAPGVVETRVLVVP